MHISVNAASFKNCLETVEKALPARSTMPVIGSILFEISDSSLTFSATNLELFIKTKMPYEGKESGKLLLPPKIVDIMRYFPGEEANININWDNYRLDISGGNAEFHLYGSDPGDYPLSFELSPDPGQPIKIRESEFKELIRSVVFAASNEETRPAFNGVLFTVKENALTLTASDTYRLAINEITDQSWSLDTRSSLVPARSLREILRVLGDQDSYVSIYNEGNIMAFQLENVYFASRLLEEKYPDVSGVIPKDYKTRITLERKPFEEAISRASLLAEGKNQAVNLIIKNSQLEVKVSGQEGSMEEVLAVGQDGEDIELFANTRFVLEILKIIDDQKMGVDFHGEGGPLIFRKPGNQNYLYLVLPIKKVN